MRFPNDFTDADLDAPALPAKAAPAWAGGPAPRQLTRSQRRLTEVARGLAVVRRREAPAVFRQAGPLLTALTTG